MYPLVWLSIKYSRKLVFNINFDTCKQSCRIGCIKMKTKKFTSQRKQLKLAKFAVILIKKYGTWSFNKMRTFKCIAIFEQEFTC